jgi:hypothetical protein
LIGGGDERDQHYPGSVAIDIPAVYECLNDQDKHTYANARLKLLREEVNSVYIHTAAVDKIIAQQWYVYKLALKHYLDEAKYCMDPEWHRASLNADDVALQKTI